MADPTAAKRLKKGGGIVYKLQLARDLIKRPKSAAGTDSASQSNSTRVSVSSASGAHDPVPGTVAGSAEPTASSKCIYLSVIDNNSNSLQAAMPSQIKVCTVLDSYLTYIADSAHPPDPTVNFQSARPPSSSVPDLVGSAVGQGEMGYAALHLRD